MVERAHKAAIRRNHQDEIALHARMHMLVVAIMAEARLRKIMWDPSGFNDRERGLIRAIQAKQAAALNKDPKLNYLPTDKVYEHGFDPLAGGFVAQPSVPFEIFDEWIEVLPTDQIVPVEVAYDPKTGQQL